jgi:hypothetical protein
VMVGVGESVGVSVGVAGARFRLPGTAQALRVRIRKMLRCARTRGNGRLFI